jgi:hypothetical protein
VTSINWLEIAGWIVLTIGAIGCSVYAGKKTAEWMNREYPIAPKPTATRSADAGPPPGAVEWVIDIQAAMGASHASNVLEALTDSCSRDQARARRIEQLEASKPVATATAAFVSVAPGASAAFEQAMSNAQLGIKAEVTP